MRSKIDTLCHLFDEYFNDEYGINGMILSFVSWKNCEIGVFKTYTYYDFCKEIVIKEWGINTYEELMTVCEEFKTYNFDNRVVYFRDGYYPGKFYEKQMV